MRLGADPEVFLLDAEFQPRSVIGRVGGTKDKPLQVDGLPKGFTLQEDNVALEFGIPPAKSKTAFVKHIQKVMEAGLSKLPEMQFATLSAVYFPKTELEHPMASVFGCEPDYNAWDGGKENIKPMPKDDTFRTAGGHVHVETELDKCEVVKAMDLFLGVPSIIRDKEGAERRVLYGRAGACRFKPYGVEYRVLSNFWIFQKSSIEWVWTATQRALEFVEKKNTVPSGVEYIINTGNRDLAKYMVKEYSL